MTTVKKTTKRVAKKATKKATRKSTTKFKDNQEVVVAPNRSEEYFGKGKYSIRLDTDTTERSSVNDVIIEGSVRDTRVSDPEYGFGCGYVLQGKFKQKKPSDCKILPLQFLSHGLIPKDGGEFVQYGTFHLSSTGGVSLFIEEKK